MKELKNVPEFSKYFRITKPSEIDIDKEDIFYRDKYNEIMNFIKVLLTNHEESILKDYLEPNGTILINVHPGTDLLDYIKIISKNYYLDLIEFNEIEILEAPNKFLKSFIPTLKAIGKPPEVKDGIEAEKKQAEQINEKKILIINQQTAFKQKFEGKNLLEIFLNAHQGKIFDFKFIDSNIIVVWINYNIQDISSVSTKLYAAFDLFIKIPLLNKIERETVLKDFLEKNGKIVFDINEIVNYTEEWEVKDILQLLKVGIFKHFLNSELNDTSNEITDVLIDLIVSGEYIPCIATKISTPLSNEEKSEGFLEEKQVQATQPIDRIEKIKDISGIVGEIRDSRISDFMLNQLYENAASMNYNELLLIIDKLNKKEALEENDRKILANHPFVLNDTPIRAQINLEKAKKRVDLIKQAFGK